MKNEGFQCVHIAATDFMLFTLVENISKKKCLKIVSLKMRKFFFSKIDFIIQSHSL